MTTNGVQQAGDIGDSADIAGIQTDSWVPWQTFLRVESYWSPEMLSMLCARFHLDEYAVLHKSANNSVSTKCFYATAASKTEVSVVRERQGPKLECLQKRINFQSEWSCILYVDSSISCLSTIQVGYELRQLNPPLNRQHVNVNSYQFLI